MPETQSLINNTKTVSENTIFTGISNKMDALMATQLPDLSLAGFTINLLLTATLAYSLGLLYIRYGRSLSNRRLFASNFVLLAATTMIVISVVKSSLALSLGLVGALSIVRFRAAIKEPEELSFLFICIAIGLGFGGDQRLATIVGFLVLAAIIIARGSFQTTPSGHNLFVTVSSNVTSNVSIEQIMRIVEDHSRSVKLKRLDETSDAIEALLAIEIENFDVLNRAREQLRKLDDSVTISFLDNDRQGQ
tara:strand:- start:496 stop:1242 length:747 start_codon:yes stop_codon:yes gene_type:complete